MRTNHIYKCYWQLVLLFFVCSNVSLGQDTAVYRFISVNRKDTLQGVPYKGAEYEFNYMRVLTGDLIYEINLFSYSETVLFKKKKDIWYVKINNKWILFYNKLIKSTAILIGEHSFKISIVKPCVSSDFLIYTASLLKGVGSANLKYCFVPQYGIIAVVSDDIILIREDLANKYEKYIVDYFNNHK